MCFRDQVGEFHSNVREEEGEADWVQSLSRYSSISTDVLNKIHKTV
jgi:hypothetical protein